MTVRKSPPSVTPDISKSMEGFKFYVGKVISPKGKWVAQNGRTRTVSTKWYDDELAESSKSSEIPKENNAAVTFSNKVRSVANSEIVHQLAKQLDSQETFSGDGDFRPLTPGNPIKEFLFEPSEKLLHELENTHSSIQQSKNSQGDSTDLTLIDTKTFKTEILTDLRFKVLDKTINYVQNPKSLKFILDEINSRSSKELFSRKHLSALKKSLSNRITILYQPTLDALKQPCNNVSKSSNGHIALFEQTIIGLHDLSVAVSQVRPSLLVKKSDSNLKENRHIIKDVMINTADDFLYEILGASLCTEEKYELLQQFNDLEESFLRPLSDLISIKSKSKKKIAKSICTPDYLTTVKDKTLPVKCYKDCQEILKIIKTHVDRLNALAANNSKDKNEIDPEKSAKPDREWQKISAALERKLSELDTPELDAQIKFVTKMKQKLANLRSIDAYALKEVKTELEKDLSNLAKTDLATHLKPIAKSEKPPAPLPRKRRQAPEQQQRKAPKPEPQNDTYLIPIMTPTSPNRPSNR